MAKKLRIAILYKDLSLGGVQKKIVDLSRALLNKENVELYILLTEEKGEFLEKIPKQAKLVDLNASLQPPAVAKLPIKLMNAFIKCQPKIVLAMMDTFGCSAVLAQTMMLKRKPKIIISQEVHASGFFQNRPWSWLRKRLVKKLYPRSNAVLSVSRAVSKDLIHNFKIPESKIVLIRNWIKFTNRQIQHSQKTIDVIFTGRLAPEKNIKLLLQSFKILNKNKPNSKLCILGYGKEEKRLRKEIERLNLDNAVLLPGFTYEIGKYLCRSRVLTITSSNEGIPLAMLEAMAYGVPVVSTNFPGVRELIIHKKTGFIADTPEDIAHWMQRLIQDEKLSSQITDQALDLIREHYSLNNLEKLTTLLTKI